MYCVVVSVYRRSSTMVSSAALAAGGGGSMPGLVWLVAARYGWFLCCSRYLLELHLGGIILVEPLGEFGYVMGKEHTRKCTRARPSSAPVLTGRHEPWRRRRTPPHE